MAYVFVVFLAFMGVQIFVFFLVGLCCRFGKLDSLNSYAWYSWMLDGIVFNGECDGSCLVVIFWFMVILVGECI